MKFENADAAFAWHKEQMARSLLNLMADPVLAGKSMTVAIEIGDGAGKYARSVRLPLGSLLPRRRMPGDPITTEEQPGDLENTFMIEVVKSVMLSAILGPDGLAKYAQAVGKGL